MCKFTLTSVKHTMQRSDVDGLQDTFDIARSPSSHIAGQVMATHQRDPRLALSRDKKAITRGLFLSWLSEDYPGF